MNPAQQELERILQIVREEMPENGNHETYLHDTSNLAKGINLILIRKGGCQFLNASYNRTPNTSAVRKIMNRVLAEYECPLLKIIQDSSQIPKQP